MDVEDKQTGSRNSVGGGGRENVFVANLCAAKVRRVNHPTTTHQKCFSPWDDDTVAVDSAATLSLPSSLSYYVFTHIFYPPTATAAPLCGETSRRVADFRFHRSTATEIIIEEDKRQGEIIWRANWGCLSEKESKWISFE